MTDEWNVFEHSAKNKPPEEIKGWKTLTPLLDLTDLHTYPLNDSTEHIFETRCPCLPTIEEIKVDNNKILRRHIIHNAWDGRERSDD